jgi:outer membrane lipoprotein-sorting protein
MKNKTKLTLIILIFMILIFTIVLIGCTQADRVSSNLSKEADSFNVARKLTVINVRTDSILFQMTGNFSIEKESDGDLAVIGENDDGTYYKHFVCLAEEITYVVEDLGTTTVNKYKYEINFNPKMIIPVEGKVID